MVHCGIVTVIFISKIICTDMIILEEWVSLLGYRTLKQCDLNFFILLVFLQVFAVGQF